MEPLRSLNKRKETLSSIMSRSQEQPSTDGYAKPFRKASLVDCRVALHRIANQLSGSCGNLIRSAFYRQGLSSRATKQRPAVVVFLLVLCADADSNWLVCRQIQPAFALRRGVHYLVICTGANGFGRKPNCLTG